MDAKGRLSVPAEDREKLMERSENHPILTNGKNCLTLYSHEKWLEIEEDLASKSSLHPQNMAYIRFVVSGATECPFDSQGRILVPPHLREHARLEREVTVAGVITHIEIWDKTLFDQENHQSHANLDELASFMAGGSN